MLFEPVNKKINAKKALDINWARDFFSPRIKKYFPGAQKLLNLDIKINRNFRGKFRNISLQYNLDIAFKNKKKTKIVRAKINSLHLCPKRHYQSLCFLEENGFTGLVSHPLDYISSLNMILYENLEGINFQNMLEEHKNLNPLLTNTPAIANFLYKLHHLPIPPKSRNLFRKGGEYLELSSRRHWAFLVRKCAPEFYPQMRYLLDELWQEKKKQGISYKGPLVLIHRDFHWGNIILIEQGKIGVIDFGDSCLDDPLIDVASFIVQTESMFRYYCPSKERIKNKIIDSFCENYFQKNISDLEKKRLFYLKSNKYLQIAAIHAFIEPNPQYKSQGLKILLEKAEESLNNLKIVL
ncbi:MAG: Phosphotransferase enzyme family protein [Parcubacteria group bacterium ADurb.Bin159]|jgi:thiamine kinase-like enzyme|nr:MAG: Phosphotransferase enzyme family protein [Parcubacteria group bacterium ADurb.Bin159]